MDFLPIDKEGANMLFQLINKRYENRSTIITSNIHFDEWANLFGDPILANVILDRLLHHAHIININGKSYRTIKNYPDLKKEINLKEAGNRLKEVCKDLNYSNVKLAKELNTTESNIRKYKMGKTLILTAFALQLNQKYDYSMDWIIGKTEKKKVKEKQKILN